jgi:hypothetical protein
MRKIFFVFLLILFSVYIFVISVNVSRWYKWYIKKNVSFVVDIDFFIFTNNKFEQIVSEYKKIGINLFAIDIENLLSIKDKLLFDNNKFVLKINNQKIYNVEEISELIKKNKDKIFSIIYLNSDKYSWILQKNFVGRKIKLEEVDNFFEQWLTIDNKKILKLNFEQQELVPKIKFSHQNVLPLRSFLCNLNQISNGSEKIKIKKAVFERSCSVIYVIPSEYHSLSENVELTKSLIDKFGNNTEFLLQRFSAIHIDKIFNFFVVIIAIVFPLVVYKKLLVFIEQNSVHKIYFFVNILTICLGITFWGFLQKYEYVVLEEYIYGTKLMFVLPFILSFFVLLHKEEQNFLLNHNLTTKEVVVGILAITIFVYLLLRTGNVNKEYVSNFELKLREQIEKYILFRPRFKEVFFAQPMFIFSLNLLKKYKTMLAKLLFCISIIYLVSIINTFLHVHTPLWLCILRSVLGIIFGWIIGETIWLFFSKIRLNDV